MRYNPDLRDPVDQGHGFEKGMGASNAGKKKKRQQKPPSYPSYVS